MMRMHGALVALLLAACATDGGRLTTVPTAEQASRGSHIQVHLETGEGTPRTFTPPRRAPVEVTEAMFEATMAKLVVGLEFPAPPRQRLALMSWGGSGQAGATGSGRPVSP